MPEFLIKIISVLVSIITTFSLTVSPIRQVLDKPLMKIATSFDAVEYDEQLVPELDDDGNWTFNTDRDLKVVQLTDIHIGGGVLSASRDKKAMNAVAAMLAYEKPDLVVLTGDMVYPVPFQSGTFNNELETKLVIALMEQLGVYYTVCFGNHDSEFYATHTREDISNLYSDPSLKYSIFQPGPDDVDGFGNQVIKVKNSKGIVTNVYYVFDSHDYTDGDILGIEWKYDNIHENQIEWYKNSVLEIDAANKAIDPTYPMFTSLAFFHIPLEEYGIAWNEYRDNGYQDTDDVKYIAGGYHETNEVSCCGIYPEQLFETMLELGSTKGIFVGHDHINNAILSYKGILLVYGMSVDYLAYPTLISNGAQRGCTTICLTQDGELEVNLENYYQDKYESKYKKESVKMQF